MADVVLEIVTCKMKEGVTDAQVIEAADALQRDVAGMPGFVGRQVLKSGDGTWVDVVRWTSEELALAAFKEIEERPSAQAFMAITDMSSVTMLHAHPVKDYAGGS
jgi:heme-degrading monooxygenase HmoA